MNKIQKLRKILKGLKSVVVAYSGGLDSTFLVKMAIDTLGKDKVLAVTARSETYPESEYKEAKRIAKKLGIRHLTISTKELNIKGFKFNPVNRCYYCKKELFGKLKKIAKKYRMKNVIDGTNLDDLKDIRHGRKAAEELDIRSPLLEARITKLDIRKMSKRLKLPTWDKPSFACLASRVPFNQVIDKKTLEAIDKAEEFIKGLDIRQVRVRSHKDIARVEVAKGDFAKLLKSGDAVTNYLKTLGYSYITMDLIGYRTGSMHESAK